MKVRETSGKKCVQGYKYVIEFNPDRKQFLTENALIELHKKIGKILNIDSVVESNFICAKQNKGEIKCKIQCGWCEGNN